MKTIELRTRSRTEFVPIGDAVAELVAASGVREGCCLVFSPHTTAGITINENADPDVRTDMLKELNSVIPFKDDYLHTEGNSAAHIKASLMGSSATVPVSGGALRLGTWQTLYFCEFDGPRTREVWVQVISG
jgi:secondary thiamine-phosphate synthase enzyme